MMDIYCFEAFRSPWGAVSISIIGTLLQKTCACDAQSVMFLELCSAWVEPFYSFMMMIGAWRHYLYHSDSIRSWSWLLHSFVFKTVCVALVQLYFNGYPESSCSISWECLVLFGTFTDSACMEYVGGNLEFIALNFQCCQSLFRAVKGGWSINALSVSWTSDVFHYNGSDSSNNMYGVHFGNLGAS